jgi:hypothetical protein
MSHTDKQHLRWIRDRLIHKYGENPNYDYMIRLQEIIDKKSKKKKTVTKKKTTSRRK